MFPRFPLVSSKFASRRPLSFARLHQVGALLVVMLIFIALVLPVLAGPGDLDPTFGQDGLVTTDFLGGVNVASGLAVQPDGRIVAVGRAFFIYPTLFLVVSRYLPDGTLDSSFDGDGRVMVKTDVSTPGSPAVAIQPDNKLVVSAGILLLRYHPDGSLDTSFGTEGKVTLPFGVHSVTLQSNGKVLVLGDTGMARYTTEGTLDQNFASMGVKTFDFASQALVLAPDGTILVAGTIGSLDSHDFALARYLENGSLDSAFGNGGVVRTDLAGESDQAHSLVLRPDNSIVVVGETGYGDGFALVAYTSNGSLDPSFGNQGKVITEFPLGIEGFGEAILQDDGKLVVAGTLRQSESYDFVMVRYASNGALDSSFGNNGQVVTDLFGGDDYVLAVAKQVDGRLIIAGEINAAAEGDFGLVRYHQDGSLDTSFGRDGLTTTDFPGGDDGAGALVLQPDGKILVAGRATREFAVARYLPDGSLDQTFGDKGQVRTDFEHSWDIGRSMILQPDGKILIIGSVGSYNESDFGLARYHPDGSLDQTFGLGGKVITSLTGAYDVGLALALQPDGRIIAGGYAYDNWALVRYNPDGTLDSTFGTEGKVITDFDGQSDDIVWGLVVLPDGKFLVGGTARVSVGTEDFALARYNPDGSLDTSFGINGKVSTNFGEMSQDVAYDLALLPDGRVLLAGFTDDQHNSNRNIALARYLPTGALDHSFGQGGKLITDLGGSTEEVNSVILQPDGKIVAVGATNITDSESRFIVVRYNPDGSLDPTFGTTGLISTDFASTRSWALAVALQADGKIVAAGRAATSSTNDFALARYQNPAPVVTSLVYLPVIVRNAHHP
jgi:uncharacterized delta-60 repeat protein